MLVVGSPSSRNSEIRFFGGPETRRDVALIEYRWVDLNFKFDRVGVSNDFEPNHLRSQICVTIINGMFS